MTGRAKVVPALQVSGEHKLPQFDSHQQRTEQTKRALASQESGKIVQYPTHTISLHTGHYTGPQET